MTSELKPCPFCGAKARLWASHIDNLEIIGCSNHLCAIEPTTEEYMPVGKAIDAWNTRAVPDVRELVRYEPDYWIDCGTYRLTMKQAANGEYVLHSEAAKIVAAKDAEIERLKDLIDGDGCSNPDKIDALFRRAEAAEAAVVAKNAITDSLKAENERLREALKPLVDQAKERNAEGLEWLNSDTVRIPVTIGELRSALNVEASNGKEDGS